MDRNSGGLHTTQAYGGENAKPLVVGSQGSFFVGGETKTSKEFSGSTTGPGAGVEGDVTVNQSTYSNRRPSTQIGMCRW